MIELIDCFSNLPALPLRLDVRRGMGKEGETVKTVRVAAFYRSENGGDYQRYSGDVCGRMVKNLPANPDPEFEAPAFAQSLLAWADKYGPLYPPGRNKEREPEPIGILCFRLIDTVNKKVWQTTRADIAQFSRCEATANGNRYFLQMKYFYVCDFYEELPDTERIVIIQDIEFAEGAKGLVAVPALREHSDMVAYFFPDAELPKKQGAMEL